MLESENYSGKLVVGKLFNVCRMTTQKSAKIIKKPAQFNDR